MTVFGSVGTTPIPISSYNMRRRVFRLQFTSSALEAGNTGRFHLRREIPPSSVVGSPSQGRLMLQGDIYEEFENYPGDPSVFKGTWWAIASAADQRYQMDEESYDAPPIPVKVVP